MYLDRKPNIASLLVGEFQSIFLLSFNFLTFFLKKFIISIVFRAKEMSVVEKKDNKYLLEKQLETLKLFYERKLLTKEQYEFEVKTLTTKIKTDK